MLIAKQYAYRGAELVVIPQPDGSIACIPSWMTRESAAHHQLRAEPRLSLEALRSLRSEIDALLSFLQSDSRMEKASNEPQTRKPTGGSVREQRAARSATPWPASPQADLFENDELHVVPPALKTRLATLVEALLLEIAASLATGEAGDDQDHD